MVEENLKDLLQSQDQCLTFSLVTSLFCCKVLMHVHTNGNITIKIQHQGIYLQLDRLDLVNILCDDLIESTIKFFNRTIDGEQFIPSSEE